MITTQTQRRFRAWLIAIALGVVATACSRDQILGTNGVAALAPTVIAETPLGGSTGVPTNNPVITATFNEPVAPITGTASMTVTCATPCANATGTVTLDATKTIATFTLTPGTALATLTDYTGTISGAASLGTGAMMANAFTWTFTTAATTDATRPRVLTTVPATTIPGPTTGVPRRSRGRTDPRSVRLSAPTRALRCRTAVAA